MRTLTFFVGAGFDKEHTRIAAATRAVMRSKAENLLSDSFDGFTSHESQGGWKDGSGTIIREPGFVFIVLVEDAPSKAAERALDAANGLCDIFNQTAVLYTVQTPELVSIAQAPLTR